jgi:hypothetical protein
MKWLSAFSLSVTITAGLELYILASFSVTSLRLLFLVVGAAFSLLNFPLALLLLLALAPLLLIRESDSTLLFLLNAALLLARSVFVGGYQRANALLCFSIGVPLGAVCLMLSRSLLSTTQSLVIMWWSSTDVAYSTLMLIFLPFYCISVCRVVSSPPKPKQD